MAYQAIGQHAQSEKIWQAIMTSALEQGEFIGWYSHIAAAMAYANIGEKELAIKALENAYDEGFRFLYSFNFDGGVERDFYEPDGYFAPIYDMPEFLAFREKVEKENARLLSRLNERYGMLDHLRNERAAQDAAQ